MALKLDDLIDLPTAPVSQYETIRLDADLKLLLLELRQFYGKKNAAEIMRRSLRAGASEAITRKKKIVTGKSA